jgi:hypothetical protein
VAETVVVPRRFSGPPGSANGGYTCGLVAGLLDGPVAEVTLRSPPPLETALAVDREAGTVRVTDGDVLVAEARGAELELDAPAPVSVEEADAASRAGEEQWSADHPFRTCVVCGPDREPGDGYRLFPGELREGLFASVWTPESSAPEQTWAALDCPTSAPVAWFGQGPPIVLARLAVAIEGQVRPDEPHVLMSWRLGVEGRKRRGAAALLGPDGAVLALSEALWIELRSGS